MAKLKIQIKKAKKKVADPFHPDNRRRGHEIHGFSCLKATEGGPKTKAEALADLKSAGLVARPGYSSYVAHYGLEVLGTERDRKKACKILFGN